MWEDQLWENSWVVVPGKRLQVVSFQQNLQKKSVSREETFHKHSSLVISSKLRYQAFVAVSEKLGGKVLVVDDLLSHKAKNYPTTSLGENCIEFEFHMDRNYYFDLKQMYLVLNFKFVKGHGYEACKTKENKKEPKKRSKSDEEATEEEKHEAAVLLFTQVKNNFLHSIFFQCWSLPQKPGNLQL